MRKMMTFVLSLALVACMLGTAYAVPSKTTNDLTSLLNIELANQSDTQSTVSAQVVPSNPTTTEVLNKIIKDTTVDKKRVVDCFDDEAKEELVALLATDVDADLNEIFTMQVADYDPSYGEVAVTVATATQYTEEQTVVAMVCYTADDVIVWKAMPAAVESEAVVITLSQEVLEAVNGEEFTVALLNA